MLHDEDEKEENNERWLLTYSDLITLLMIFFVIMYSMSNVDAEKYKQLSQSLNSAFGGSAGVIEGGNSKIEPGSDNLDSLQNVEFKKVGEEIQKYLNENDMANSVSLKVQDRGLVIRLKDTILFDTGKSIVKDNSRDKIIQIGKMLNEMNSYMRVEGHTDNMSIKNSEFKSNWDLSVMRATNVVQLLIDNAGISPDKLSAVGYGEFRPIAENSSEEGRSKNRRVDIVLVDSKYDNVENVAKNK
ncbi:MULTISPECIES: flagellar motor protein MotB [unclassified Clostridioides]|uniref:OmpA/MotB family protein n=1 Tax=unclassified Clostridioides TaxID=2635829 RepID=UPI001D0FDEBA|nr:flagellar motor protein MotB [Clostridioides sp. ES-S-0171-01]MCC0686750.1 flagellar motor protein MotB [Clostridioides sp. ES-S-0056-01]MCC0713734.1 flagellar motor protein MotB [Clostridioides sp. ES-S-0077-01]UDN55327.1 flagellar motor protein MotB [Clostridioides sp. ES-S-0054-01]